MNRPGLDELQAVGEGTALTHHGVSLDGTVRQFEFQPNYFAHRILHTEHRRNAALADIHRLPAHHAGVAGVDPDRNFEPIAGMAPLIHEIASLTRPQLTLQAQL